MSKKIVFKGTPDGCFLPFEPDLLQLDLQEPNSTELPSDYRMKQIEDFQNFQSEKQRTFVMIRSRKVTGQNCVCGILRSCIIRNRTA